MPTKLPYVSQPGSVIRVFEKVRTAQTPERFTVDFLQTKLGCRGGPYRQFIPLAKKLNFLGTDGQPTDIYKQFRNDATSGAAMAQAIKNGFHEIFVRNEYAGNLSKEQIKGMVVEITGLDTKNRVVGLVCQTFEALKKLASFDVALPERVEEPAGPVEGTEVRRTDEGAAHRDFNLGLSYTINLVLPKSDDPAVFNAIFRSLRENLLRR